MLKDSFLELFLLISILSLIEAHFDFKLGYCRFKCVDPCKEEKGADKPLDASKKPSGYYWRDFYGEIPSDAYPLGNSNQNPQTYIGIVFVPSKNGTFVTTIVDGLDYVYVVNQTVTVKKSIGKTSHIQILCTMEPERFVWFKLSATNAATLDTSVLSFVFGSYQKVMNDGQSKQLLHFITKIPHCSVNYAGSMKTLNDKMEYALLDGTPMTTESPLWLFYRNETKGGGHQNKARPFISHRYEYNIRPYSIIPSFYKQFTLGDCSITCTNEGSGKKTKAKPETEAQAAAAMEYYWQPNAVFNPEEALKVGELFIGQSYCGRFNWYDVGRSSNGETVFIAGAKRNYAEWLATQFMCSNRPELFEWVNSTSTTIDQLDQSRMIPGGKMDNGTQVFVGRIGDEVGSIRVFHESALIYTYYGEEPHFQVLMYKDPQKKKQS